MCAMRNIDDQLRAGKDDPDFGHKCAMLLLGMHRWTNQQNTNVTFTDTGNLAYQISIRSTLDPTKYILWGKNGNANNPYVAIPVCYLDNGNHTNRSLTDRDGQELPATTYAETSFITKQALWYLWNQIPSREEIQYFVEGYFNKIDSSMVQFPKRLNNIFRNISSDNRKDHVSLREQDQHNEQHWQSARLADLANLVTRNFVKNEDQQSFDEECTSFRLECMEHLHKLINSSDNNSASGNATLLTCALFLGLLDWIRSSHHENNSDTEADPTSRHAIGDENMQALTSLLLLLSNLCKQYPLIALVPQSDTQPKMLFTLRFDTTYPSLTNPQTWPQRISEAIIGPTHLSDTVNLGFQSYAARASHIEVTPIEHTDVESVKEITKEPPSKSENIDKASNKKSDIKMHFIAGRIHCVRYFSSHQPITYIQLNIIPDQRTLQYSLLWSLLLAALSTFNLVSLFGYYPMISIFTGDNLIAGLSMIFTLWLAKTLSGINNSLSDHVRQKLDDTISKSLIFYSISYASAFLNLGIRYPGDHEGLTLPQLPASIIKYATLAITILTGLVTLIISAKVCLWSRHRRKANDQGEINNKPYPLDRVSKSECKESNTDTLEEAPFSILSGRKERERVLKIINEFLENHW
ncbi:hypothetical protein [Bifidobacterium callimiconis]|uniref:Uncharacterized protein n=1 Tax=Bifidobacterium callimiconis TaxID=2306973 RepID=A0A430FGK7_9BIFI|nr:hypothetical protein [Bifidobacterium callimiconis]RSX52004.1 hypothetical protein D2E23_0611 [Bifidobacterium callimiconis]